MNTFRIDSYSAPATTYPNGPLEPYDLPYVPLPRFAGFWRRFVSSSIDGVLVIIATTIIAALIGVDGEVRFQWLVSKNSFSLNSNSGFLLALAIGWLYYALLESSSLQATLGKRVLGLAVAGLDCRRISFGRATARYFAKYLSFYLFLIGYLIQPFTRKRQALHDLIAGALVVKS
jgi:uncharacterized RDD family membrane protein YckC